MSKTKNGWAFCPSVFYLYLEEDIAFLFFAVAALVSARALCIGAADAFGALLFGTHHIKSGKTNDY